MIIDLEGRVEVANMPSGVVGQISFGRLVRQLRAAGEIKPDETITHLRISVRDGVIEYRIEKIEAAS